MASVRYVKRFNVLDQRYLTSRTRGARSLYVLPESGKF